MAEENAFIATGERLIRQILGVAIKGSGPLKPAAEVAEEHLISAGGDREQAIRRLIATHVRMAAVSGFVTGLGGVVTLPVTVPASIAGLYIVAARMSAAIAHLRGYDITTDEVQSAVAVSLLGSTGASTLKKAGIEIGQKSTAAALKKVPGRVLIEINKKIGFRLITKAGEKGVINLSKLVPLVGGPIGATVDGVSTKTIAGYATRTFPPLIPRTSSPFQTPDVVDAELVDEEVVEVKPNGPAA
jgi:hypothetical protein